MPEVGKVSKLCKKSISVALPESEVAFTVDLPKGTTYEDYAEQYPKSPKLYFIDAQAVHKHLGDTFANAVKLSDNPERRAMEIEWMKDLFVRNDSNGNMELQQHEFTHMMWSVFEIDEEPARGLYTMMDTDNSNGISWNELVALFYAIDKEHVSWEEWVTQPSRPASNTMQALHVRIPLSKDKGKKKEPLLAVVYWDEFNDKVHDEFIKGEDKLKALESTSTDSRPYQCLTVWKRVVELFPSAILFTNMEPDDFAYVRLAIADDKSDDGKSTAGSDQSSLPPSGKAAAPGEEDEDADPDHESKAEKLERIKNTSWKKLGDVGDTWLLSAIANLLEFPGAVQSVFQNKTITTNGLYSFKLFDVNRVLRKPKTQQWTEINIDDYIPCENGYKKDANGKSIRIPFADGRREQPWYTKPPGDEIWVCLLEKALAKLCGGYEHLRKCGQKGTLFVWQAITGCDQLFEFRKVNVKSDDKRGNWQTNKKELGSIRWQHINVTFPGNNPEEWKGTAGDLAVLMSAKLFRLLCEYDKKNFVMGCSKAGRKEEWDDKEEKKWKAIQDRDKEEKAIHHKTKVKLGVVYSIIHAMTIEASAAGGTTVALKNGDRVKTTGRISRTGKVTKEVDVDGEVTVNFLGKKEQIPRNQLVQQHKFELVCLRNPHGEEGDFVSREIRKLCKDQVDYNSLYWLLNIENKPDGLCWMTFDEFCLEWDHISIACYSGNADWDPDRGQMHGLPTPRGCGSMPGQQPYKRYQGCDRTDNIGFTGGKQYQIGKPYYVQKNKCMTAVDMNMNTGFSPFGGADSRDEFMGGDDADTDTDYDDDDDDDDEDEASDSSDVLAFGAQKVQSANAPSMRPGKPLMAHSGPAATAAPPLFADLFGPAFGGTGDFGNTGFYPQYR